MMKGLALEDLNIDEDRYQAWKAEQAAKREAKKVTETAATVTPRHIPLNPQEIITSRLENEARAIVHVEASSTEDVLAHIDDLLKAS